MDKCLWELFKKTGDLRYYILYTNNTHDGKNINGIYYDGNVTLKDIIKFNNKTSFKVYNNVTEVTATNN